jgi:hypothetical protein
MEDNRSVFMIDLDAIKINSMVFHMPTPEQFSNKIKILLKRHHVSKVSVVGHSFGTITAGWLVKHQPEIVSHLTLIDPVSLLLGLPDVAYSFLYKKPKSFIEWIIYIFGSRELTISHTLHRQFWWYRNVLWLEEVPSHIGVVVGLAGKDEVLNALALFEYTNLCREKRVKLKEKKMSEDFYCDFFNDDQKDLTTTFRECSSKINRSFVHSSSTSSIVNNINSNTISGLCISSSAASLSVSNSYVFIENDFSSKNSRIANIECVFWPEYSHGQILLPTKHQKALVNLINKNEKYSCV